MKKVERLFKGKKKKKTEVEEKIALPAKRRFLKAVGKMVKGLNVKSQQRRKIVEANCNKAVEDQGVGSGKCTMDWDCRD